MERSGSPGASISATRLVGSELAEIKFSFRGGGEKVFYDRLKGAMIQRKWLLEGAPSIPKPLQSFDADAPRDDARRPEEGAGRAKIAGIAGLEQRDLALRKQNELVIGNAFADLEALMTSAKEIVALAEKFAERLPGNSAAGSSEASAVLSRSAAALGLVTTKDMLSTGSTSETLYLSQLSRNLAEFLTDDATGILRREGGIMSLVDLWAVFNRARGGVELVSPTDFRKAVDMWEKLRLPLRLRRFRSGLLVVQGKDWSDDKTLASVAAWLQELHTADAVPPGAAWDWRLFGRGVTPRETAERFRWSVGVATEELEMAEENGFLCREESVEGVRFWENWLVADLAGPSWSSEAPPGTSSNDLVAAEQGVTSLTL
ncbi:MAG: hypothetical protein M1838_001062 [Thelocarpon superellum]|nr:MAG: hypothetical protein M1838_001062 [Thelocarpon superellum]